MAVLKPPSPWRRERHQSQWRSAAAGPAGPGPPGEGSIAAERPPTPEVERERVDTPWSERPVTKLPAQTGAAESSRGGQASRAGTGAAARRRDGRRGGIGQGRPGPPGRDRPGRARGGARRGGTALFPRDTRGARRAGLRRPRGAAGGRSRTGRRGRAGVPRAAPPGARWTLPRTAGRWAPPHRGGAAQRAWLRPGSRGRAAPGAGLEHAVPRTQGEATRPPAAVPLRLRPG